MKLPITLISIPFALLILSSCSNNPNDKSNSKNPQNHNSPALKNMGGDTISGIPNSLAKQNLSADQALKKMEEYPEEEETSLRAYKQIWEEISTRLGQQFDQGYKIILVDETKTRGQRIAEYRYENLVPKQPEFQISADKLNEALRSLILKVVEESLDWADEFWDEPTILDAVPTNDWRILDVWENESFLSVTMEHFYIADRGQAVLVSFLIDKVKNQPTTFAALFDVDCLTKTTAFKKAFELCKAELVGYDFEGFQRSIVEGSQDNEHPQGITFRGDYLSLNFNGLRYPIRILLPLTEINSCLN